MTLPLPIKARVHVRIEGRVQGVGYRYFAMEKALALGITGWVRNLPSGDVEAQAEGPKEALQEWLSDLQQGPTLSRVTHLAAQWQPVDDQFENFEVR